MWREQTKKKEKIRSRPALEVQGVTQVSGEVAKLLLEAFLVCGTASCSVVPGSALKRSFEIQWQRKKESPGEKSA
jgi:hypothetical protein